MTENEITSGTLFVVATPIGNLDDITLRALRVLAEVDWIAAEDTRHTGKLLTHHGIDGHLVSLHEHNEAERVIDLVGRLTAGSSGALVSDAGTPSVSDPGFRLVRAAVAASIPVVPIPGVSAAIAALSASGLPTDAFVFVGFLPKKAKRRREMVQSLAGETRTLIFYESPQRLAGLMDEMISELGDRHAVLAREMTKRHEEFLRGHLSHLAARLKDRASIRGECTLLVSGRRREAPRLTEPVIDRIRGELGKPGRRLSEVVKEIAAAFGIPRSQVYDAALKLKNGRGTGVPPSSRNRNDAQS